MKLKYCLVALSAGLPLIFQAASATEGTSTETEGTESTALQEIVVTAQKRSENLQEVPIAVTALGASQLTALGVTTSQDLAAAVPGLQVENVAGGVSPRLRGVGSSAIAGGLEADVATYIDGVYYAYGPDVVMDLSDVSQISVLKGPQGTLFGRNATGGVLQITTLDPTQDFHANVSTGLDNYLTSRSSVYVSGGLADNVAAGIAAEYTTQKNGWGTNIYDGSQTFKINHDASVRGKLIYDLPEDTVIKLSADYTNRAGNPYINLRPFPGYNATIPWQSSNPWDTNNYLDSTNTYSGGGASVTVAHNFSFATLTSISAYRSSNIDFDFTIAEDVPQVDVNVPEHSTQYTEEVQLVSPSDRALTWTTGVFYFYNRAAQSEVVSFHGGYAGPLQQEYLPGAQDASSVAGYGQVTYSFTPDTRVTAGVRYTYEKKTYAGDATGIFPGGISVVLIPNLTAPNNSLTYEKPTWRLALDHDFTKDVIGYISYNRGFKSGGFDIRAAGTPPFKPEQLDAYEIGLKNEFFDRRARLNLAAFLYNYKEIQVPIFEVEEEAVINGAAARIYGLDEDFTANVTDALQVNLSSNYLHARFTTFPNAQFSIPDATLTVPTIVTGDATGNVLPYSPTFTAVIGAEYLIRSAVGGFSLNLNDSYDSGFYGEADNRLRQPSYHLLNGSVTWKSNDTHTSVRVYSNNMLNKAVASQISTVSNAYIVDYSNPPRIYGITLKYEF